MQTDCLRLPPDRSAVTLPTSPPQAHLARHVVCVGRQRHEPPAPVRLGYLEQRRGEALAQRRQRPGGHCGTGKRVGALVTPGQVSSCGQGEGHEASARLISYSASQVLAVQGHRPTHHTPCVRYQLWKPTHSVRPVGGQLPSCVATRARDCLLYSTQVPIVPQIQPPRHHLPPPHHLPDALHGFLAFTPTPTPPAPICAATHPASSP